MVKTHKDIYLTILYTGQHRPKKFNGIAKVPGRYTTVHVQS